MAIGLVQGSSGTNWRKDGGNTNIASLDITGTATTPGNLLILAVAYNSAGSSISTVTDAGNVWTFIDRHLHPGTATPIEFWMVKPSDHDTAVTTVTITFSGSLRAAAMLSEWSGADSAGTLDQTTAKANVTGSASCSPSITTLTDGSLVVSIANNNQTTTPQTVTWTGSTSFTGIGAQSGRVLTKAYLVVSPAAAQTITWTKDTATGAIAGMSIAIKPAAGGGGGVTAKSLAALGVG